jgi:hypothetical protein
MSLERRKEEKRREEKEEKKSRRDEKTREDLLACLHLSEEPVYPFVILSCLFVLTLWSHLRYLSATLFFSPSLLPAHNFYFGL